MTKILFQGEVMAVLLEQVKLVMPINNLRELFCKQIETALGQFSKNQFDSNQSPQSKLLFWQILHPKNKNISMSQRL